jgi:hypothetical protein
VPLGHLYRFGRGVQDGARSQEEMMRLSLAAMLLLLFALPVQARDWQLVGGNDQVRSYIDMGTIERSGDTAAASLLSALSGPVGSIYAVETRVVYDCTQLRFRELDIIGYSATGEILGRNPPEDPDAYYPTAPGAVDEGARQYACFGQGGVGKLTDPFADAAKAFGWKH